MPRSVRWTYWNPQGAIFNPLSEAMAFTVNELGMDAKTNLRERLPRTARQQTGELHRSIRGFLIGRYTGKIVARTKYAASQELGSKPHEIHARRKPVLMFPWEGALYGDYFVGPRVNHPGTKGLNFLWDAAQNFERHMVTWGRRMFL